EASSSTDVVFAFAAPSAGGSMIQRAARIVLPAAVLDWFDARWNSTPIRIGNVVTAPRRLFNTTPIYPGRTGESTASGDVVVELQTRRDGSVANARIVRSVPLFDRYALDAALGR